MNPNADMSAQANRDDDFRRDEMSKPAMTYVIRLDTFERARYFIGEGGMWSTDPRVAMTFSTRDEATRQSTNLGARFPVRVVAL